MHRKFAVIKLWPEVKAAEDEVIARLQIAARVVDVECVVVDSFARLLDAPHTQLTADDVDFVLSLHFQTPKRYDIFSLVTLWNPLLFYVDNYRKFTRNLLTHDDFLSCHSASGDDHVMRSVSRDPMRDGPRFHLYPSVSGPILEPTLGERKLFYTSINWERAWNRPMRHPGLVELLDEDQDFRLYGPKVFNGVEVWEGYRSYQGPIPFDGVSVVRLIHQAGIALVLSSEAHRVAGMMSSRIFESSAAGAVIVCDDNSFARRHFGDSLLYVDTTAAPEETYRQIRRHLDWIRASPEKALEMARASQAIFREGLRLDTCLAGIYQGLEERKRELAALYTPRAGTERVCVVFLMDGGEVDGHVASYVAQKGVAMRGLLAVDAGDLERVGPKASRAGLEILPVGLGNGRALGDALNEILGKLAGEEYVCFVGPEERLFSDHLSGLLRRLQDVPEAGCAWSDMLVEEGETADLADDPDVNGQDETPIGCGRFLFRLQRIEPRVGTALPYLDRLAMHLLFGIEKSVPTRRCTLAAPREHGAPGQLEREILIDFAPQIFQVKKPRPQPPVEPQAPPPPPPPPAPIEAPPRAVLTLDGMSAAERTRLAVELAHSVPMPGVVRKLAFGLYRVWLRLTRR